MVELSIIIVSYNTEELTLNCLASLYKSISGSFLQKIEIIVIDNGSTDQSVNQIEKLYPDVSIIKNRENRGFAFANNQGMKQSKGKWLLLLNSDTLILPNTIEKTWDFVSQNVKYSVIGIRLLNPDGTTQSSAGHLPDLMNTFFWMLFLDDIPVFRNQIRPYHIENKQFYEQTHEVGWVTGAFFMVNKEVYVRTGGFDESLFMYGEEVEWCERIRQSGYKIGYFASASVVHLKGKSGIGKNAGLVEEISSLKYFFLQHRPAWQKNVLRLFLKVGSLMRLTFFGIIAQDKAKFHAYVKAYKLA